MSAKNDDISARPAQGRYDLPGGSYEIIETDVSGSAGAPVSTAIGRRVITTYRPAYLSEDETVLACCHHAHEVAKAHGAREVMLEHLVHALVRVPDASQVLSDRGINVESLKRESAAVISSEIPVDHTMMVAQLRASKDFNTVMHLAAAAASRRDERQLGARDLLDALLRFDAKSRVVRMIRRHAVESEMDEPVDPLAEVKGLMERYAGEQRDLRLAVNELRNAQAGQSSAALAGIDDRMRGLERSINLLVGSGGGARSDVGDTLKNVQDVLGSIRNESRAANDRLQLMERAITSGGVGAGAGNGQITTLIGDRFLSVQKTMEDHRLGISRLEQGLSDRMRLMEAKQLTTEPVEALGRKLEKLEASLQERLTDNGKLESMLIDRLKGFEAIAANSGGKPLTLPPGLETLGDRMQGLERQVSAQRSELQGWQGAMEKELKAIEEMFDLIPADGGAARPGLSDGQMQTLQQSIDAHRGETQRVAIAIQERHGALERMVDQRLANVGNMGGVGERLAGLERLLTNQRTDQLNNKGSLDSELEQIRKAMMALGNAQSTLSTAIDEWRQNNSGDLSVISNRLAKLEHSTLAAPAVAAPPVYERVASSVDRQVERPLFGGVSNGNGSGVSITAQPSAPPAPPVSVVTTASVPIPQGTTPPAPSGGLLDRVDRVLAGRVNSN